MPHPNRLMLTSSHANQVAVEDLNPSIASGTQATGDIAKALTMHWWRA
jgi:hypothetical protein